MTSSSWGSVGPRHPCVCYPGWKWPVESGASTWLWCCLGWLTLGPRMVTPPCGFLFSIQGCWQPLCGCVVRTKWEHTWWGQHTESGGDALTVGMLLLRLPCLFSSMSPSCFLAAHCSVSGCCPLFHHVCVSFSAGDLYQPFGSLGGGSLQHRAVPWGHWALVNSVNIGVAALVLARSVSTTAEVEAFAPSLISVSFFFFFPFSNFCECCYFEGKLTDATLMGPDWGTVAWALSRKGSQGFVGPAEWSKALMWPRLVSGCR